MAYKHWRHSIFGTIIVIRSFIKNETRPLIRLRKERTNEISQSPKLQVETASKLILQFRTSEKAQTHTKSLQNRI